MTQGRNPYTREGTGGDERPSKGGILSGLSVAQIVASALAAVTSMLLSSQIGIAGSVIGVAVGSIVATVSSQLYKGVLNASAERIRNAHADDDVTAAAAQSNPSVTSVVGGDETDDTITRMARHTADGRAESGTPIAPASLRSEASSRRKRQVAARIAIVGLLAGLAAVGLTALVINLATAGNGIGAKTEPVFSQPAPATTPSTSAQTAAAQTASDTTSATTSAKTDVATTSARTEATSSTTASTGSTSPTSPETSAATSAASTSATTTTS